MQDINKKYEHGNVPACRVMEELGLALIELIASGKYCIASVNGVVGRLVPAE